MKKIILAFYILFFGFSSSFGQTITDTLSIKKTGGKYEFSQKNIKLSLQETKDALKTNEVAYKEFNKAQSNKSLSNICGTAGGFLIGFPLGQALAGGDANWTLVGIGAGLIAVAIPLQSKSGKQYNNAVNLFNDDLKMKDNIIKKEIRMGLNSNGLSVALLF